MCLLDAFEGEMREPDPFGDTRKGIWLLLQKAGVLRDSMAAYSTAAASTMLSCSASAKLTTATVFAAAIAAAAAACAWGLECRWAR